MNRLKSFFLFSKEHRSGIVLLLILIGITQLAYYWCFNSNMNLYFGGDILGGLIEYYNGRFDDIRIYSRALNQSEISYLFNN